MNSSRMSAEGMRRTALGLLLALVAAAVAAQQPSARELLESAEDTVFPDSFEATIVLTTTEDGEKVSELELDLQYKSGAGSYMEVVAPARSRGLRFLQSNENLWMYNPRAGGGRAIRLSPRASFQGSVFSNRDLSNPEFADDYDVALTRRQTIDHDERGEVETYRLEADARDEQQAYARVVLWVAISDRTLLRSHYFAKSGLLFKTAEYSGFRELAGANRPSVIEMVSQQNKGRKSTMEVTQLEATDDLPDRRFTQQYLTR